MGSGRLTTGVEGALLFLPCAVLAAFLAILYLHVVNLSSGDNDFLPAPIEDDCSLAVIAVGELASEPVK
jgi:hypothetical protein